jgi:dTDP-4-dehydrorhamnose 3,5-epimerase
MQFKRLQIPELMLVTPEKQGDQRGYFSETFRVDSFAAQGIAAAFVQDNHVYSAHKGVLRGLHFQSAPRTQGKFIRCARGAILDVAVDIRIGSPTYGHHVGVELSCENWLQLWVPPGFAHGYLTLEENCEVIYKVTDYYAPECDRGIAWDDPALGIDWRLSSADITLSERDRNHPRLAEAPPEFQYGQ